MLIKKIEDLLMKQNSLPAFGFKCIKFKEMFSNPDGIPFLAYFSERNKCSVFYFFFLELGLADSLAKKSWFQWEHKPRRADRVFIPSRGSILFAWMNSTAAWFTWILLFHQAWGQVCSCGRLSAVMSSQYTHATPPSKESTSPNVESGPGTCFN